MNKKAQFLIAGLIIVLIIGIGSSVWSSSNVKNVPAVQEKSTQQNVNGSSLQSKELFTLKRSTPIINDVIRFGVDKGFFEEEGIRFEEVGVLAPGTDLAALLKGDIDVTQALHFGFVMRIARGAEIKAVLSRGRFKPEGPHHRWLVLNNSTIRTAKDLIGKKIAVMGRNGCTDYAILEYMSQSGIYKPDEKAELVVLPVPNMEQALISGKVDVIGPIAGTWLSNNYLPKKILSRGGVRELRDIEYEAIRTDYEVVGAPGWFFATKFIKEHPEAVRGFVRGMLKTHQYINQHFDEYSKWVAEKDNISADWVEPPTVIGDGLVTDEGVEADTLPAVKQFGLRKEEYQHIKWSDTYTNEFNPNYKK